VSEIDRYIEAAMSSANRAASLTHRLLAFARRQSLNQCPVDVNHMVMSMDELVRRTIGESIELEVDLHATSCLTNTDEHQLENALLNLVINARDAMPDGGRLLIQTELTHIPLLQDALAPGDYVRLRVQDTGLGMSSEVIARAFDPFFTTKPIGQGTGLGLSMVYGFINQTGGRVSITSEEGRGTRIDLLLPCHHDAAEQAPAVDRSIEPLRASQGERVLVVEDEPDVRMLVVDVLKDLGYRVQVACDSHEALLVLQGAEPIDLLVTDVGLPGLNGRQLAEVARQHRPGLKVLFMTGYAREAQVRGDFLDDGMELLTKPFSIDELARRVSRLIETP
jgi:CheY-like chemotaxis protein